MVVEITGMPNQSVDTISLSGQQNKMNCGLIALHLSVNQLDSWSVLIQFRFRTILIERRYHLNAGYWTGKQDYY